MKNCHISIDNTHSVCSGAEAHTFWLCWINTMAADALVPCVTRSWADMALMLQDEGVFVFHQRSQPTAPSVSSNDIMEIIFMFPGNSSTSKVSAMECDIDGSEQDCSMSSALVLEILQSCTKPSLCPCNYSWVKWHISWLIVSHWCQGRYNVNTNILKIVHHQKTCNFVPACSTDGNSHFVMATQAVQLPAFFSASCSQFRPGEKK